MCKSVGSGLFADEDKFQVKSFTEYFDPIKFRYKFKKGVRFLLELFQVFIFV